MKQFTVQQLAAVTGEKVATIYRLVESGALAHVRMGDGPKAPIRITEDDWHAYQQRHRVAAKDERPIERAVIRRSVADLPGADRYVN